MTSTRIIFITNIPTPYKRPRLNALGNIEGVELIVHYSAKSNHRHEYLDIPGPEFEIIPPPERTLNTHGVEMSTSTKFAQKIISYDADVYIIGGWNYLSSWISLIIGKWKNIPVGIISANTDQGKFSKPVLS